jgi:hypothetical protein
MTESKPRLEPPVLKRQGFRLCREVFDVPGAPRIGGSRLLELFDPFTFAA